MYSMVQMVGAVVEIVTVRFDGVKTKTALNSVEGNTEGWGYYR